VYWRSSGQKAAVDCDDGNGDPLAAAWGAGMATHPWAAKPRVSVSKQGQKGKFNISITKFMAFHIKQNNDNQNTHIKNFHAV